MVYDIIVAITPTMGIGKDGTIPWYDKTELEHFKNLTSGHILIVGRKTLDTLPKLSNRIILCITRNDSIHPKEGVILFTNFLKAIEYAQEYYSNKKIFVAGGSEIYDLALMCPHMIDHIHISIMSKNYECDTYINLDFNYLTIVEKKVFDTFTYNKMKINFYGEAQYLNLLYDVLTYGNIKEGRNGKTLSLFTAHLCFDLRNGYPLITTKKMFIKGIIEELLFFLKGESNSKKLEEKGVNIWKQNTNRQFLNSIGLSSRPEGIMGPMYGCQWRHFNGNYNDTNGISSGGIDQLALVISLLKQDKNSRRILMTDFNPSQADLGVLYPCHSIIQQFYVENDLLHCFCFNRSSDLFLGLPFNIASTSLLLLIIAKCVGLKPGCLYLSLGDAHIYDIHKNSVKQQIMRQPYSFPQINIKKELNNIRDIERLTFDDFELINYQYHPKIIAPMVP